MFPVTTEYVGSSPLAGQLKLLIVFWMRRQIEVPCDGAIYTEHVKEPGVTYDLCRPLLYLALSPVTKNNSLQGNVPHIGNRWR